MSELSEAFLINSRMLIGAGAPQARIRFIPVDPVIGEALPPNLPSARRIDGRREESPA